MKVICPVSITDSTYTGGSISEPDAGETAWVSAGTYALGDVRIRTTTHRKYVCIQASTGRTALPEVDAAYWSDAGPTNKWAAFDASASTASTASGSMSFVITPGYCDSIAFFGVSCTSLTVTQRDAPGGAVLATSTTTVDATAGIVDWYDYFFAPYLMTDALVLPNAFLPYATNEITITLTGTTVSLGVIVVGTLYDLGNSAYGVRASIIDYSTKTTDSNGNTTLVKRAYSKRIEAATMIDSVRFNVVFAILSNIRSTPAAWIATDQSDYSTLNFYGYFKDFSLEIAYPTASLCSLQIEGLA